MNKLNAYFLGCNTPKGFMGYAEELQRDPAISTLYILKGFSGSGKSTILKEIRHRAMEEGGAIEEIYCTADHQSLDGIILKDRKIAVFDGTLPHPLEPKAWGLKEETVDLMNALDTQALRQDSEKVYSAITSSREQHGVCCDYLAGAAAFVAHNRRIAQRFTDHEKIKRTAESFVKHYQGSKGDGIKRKRVMTAITNGGITTLPCYMEEIVMIHDPFGASSGLFLQEISALLEKQGVSFISCTHPLFFNEVVEQILIPEWNLAFLTDGLISRPSELPNRMISYRRFTDLNGMKRYKKELSLGKKSALALLDGGVKASRSACDQHLVAEKIYHSHADYSVISDISEKLMLKIFR